MLILATSLINTPLLSIRMGGNIGSANEPIINPHNLHIDGFYCSTSENDNGIILDMDIREISGKGLIIDDHFNVSDEDDLVRLKDIINIKFKLIGKPIYSGRTKLGKITDYAIDTKSLFVIKLYAQPSILKSVKTDQLIFDRTQIIEITDHKVVVSGPESKQFSLFGQKIQSASFNSASTSSISE
jgi:hypothetical protein